MENQKIIDKIISQYGIAVSKNIAIDILILCKQYEEQSMTEKIELHKQEKLHPYKVGKFVKYVRLNPSNKHLFTLGKNYEILTSEIEKNKRENYFFCRYTILDDFGKRKKYHTTRQNSFELVES